MALPAEHIWSDMEAVIAVNSTQDELPPNDDLGNVSFLDYDPNNSATPSALPTLAFEGVNFPEDPIRLPSVQVLVSRLSLHFPSERKRCVNHAFLVSSNQPGSAVYWMFRNQSKSVSFTFHTLLICLNDFLNLSIKILFLYTLTATANYSGNLVIFHTLHISALLHLSQDKQHVVLKNVVMKIWPYVAIIMV